MKIEFKELTNMTISIFRRNGNLQFDIDPTIANYVMSFILDPNKSE